MRATLLLVALAGTSAAQPKSPPIQPICDFDERVAQGDDAYRNGLFAKALGSYEAALECKPDRAIVPKAFAASCRSRNAAKAKLYYKQMSTEQQSTYAQICMREGTDFK